MSLARQPLITAWKGHPAPRNHLSPLGGAPVSGQSVLTPWEALPGRSDQSPLPGSTPTARQLVSTVWGLLPRWSPALAGPGSREALGMLGGRGWPRAGRRCAGTPEGPERGDGGRPPPARQGSGCRGTRGGNRAHREKQENQETSKCEQREKRGSGGLQGWDRAEDTARDSGRSGKGLRVMPGAVLGTGMCSR